MNVLHKVLLAVIGQLQERGGVLHAEAEYWLMDLKADAAKVPGLEARLAAAEEKIEYLAEHVGLKPPEETPEPEPAAEEMDEPYEDEDPRFD